MAHAEIEGMNGGTLRLSIDTDDPTGDRARIYVQTKADGDRASWGPMIAIHPAELRVAVNGLLFTDRAQKRWEDSVAPDEEPAGRPVVVTSSGTVAP